MKTVAAATTVPLAPEAARRLWTDLRRWPTFVEGFARVVEADEQWPAEGARVVWDTGPRGRGRVTEKVVETGADRLVTQVFEERLSGTQHVSFAEEAEGARVELRLAYELSRQDPLHALADLLFVRRALRDALRRTVRRFAIEAEDEAGLR